MCVCLCVCVGMHMGVRLESVDITHMEVRINWDVNIRGLGWLGVNM